MNTEGKMQDTIAIVFDFDETLAPDSTSSFLESTGTDVRKFWSEIVQKRIDEGWDPVPAYLYEMIYLSYNAGKEGKITKDKLQKFGKKINYYNGATRIFMRLKKHAESIEPTVSLEYYLISSGIKEILCSTKISKFFQHIWASDFHCNEKGEIEFPKNIVSFTDKTRYIFHLSKGIFGEKSLGKPFEVNRKIPAPELRIPLDQVIFIGDGYTDIPCFSLVRNHGGVAIGVYDQENREKWGKAWGFIEDGRVSNLVPADYGSKSALSNSLIMAVESITRKIVLRRTSYQG
jgi:phosphoserine phosphatase